MTTDKSTEKDAGTDMDSDSAPRDAVTEASKAGGHAFDLGEELLVGQRPAVAPLVERDQSRGIAAHGRHVAIERVG